MPPPLRHRASAFPPFPSLRFLRLTNSHQSCIILSKEREKRTRFRRNTMRSLNTSFPPIRPFLRLNAQPLHSEPSPAPSSSPLFPTRLGFSRAQTTPKSQLFRGFPLFLETVAPQSSAALPQLPLAPLAPWREKTQLEESRPLPEAPRREEVLAFSLRLCFNKSREAAVRSER